MPLPTSGNLSLNDIHLEVGGDNQDLCGMNDADFRLLVNKGDQDQQSIVEYRGKSAAFELSEKSFFFRVAPTSTATWTPPGRGVNNVAVNGYAHPKHMIPATQVDDNEYLCTNFYDNNHPTTVGNKLFLAKMNRAGGISWAKEYTTYGDMSVGTRTFPNQRLTFDPKMFKLGGNYYAIVYPKYLLNLDTEGSVDFATTGIPYDVGYDFAAGVCKFNSSGQFQWCRYINVKAGVASDSTPNLERSGVAFQSYGQGHFFDKNGYVYLTAVTTVGDVHDPVTNNVTSGGIVKFYLYKISLLTGSVEDTIALSSTSVQTQPTNLFFQGFSKYGIGAHEDDPSKFYIHIELENDLVYWEVDISGSSMSLGTERRIGFNVTNVNEPFIDVSSPVWLPDNKIKVYAQEAGFKGFAGANKNYLINRTTGAIQHSIPEFGFLTSVGYGVTVDQNDNLIYLSGTGTEIILVDAQAQYNSNNSIVKINKNQQHTNANFYAERYMAQVYGTLENGTTAFIQGRVYHMGNIETTSGDGDFAQFTTQHGVFVINKNNLSSNVGTFGSNKYRFLINNSEQIPNGSNVNQVFNTQNTAFFNYSNSVAPTVFSTSILSSGSNFTPITPANTGGDNY